MLLSHHVNVNCLCLTGMTQPILSAPSKSHNLIKLAAI